jgi:hypothetical protein
LQHSELDYSRGFAGQGAGASNDAVCRIAWYREYARRVPPCWLLADPAHAVAAFGTKWLFRPAAAYLKTKDDATYHFTINVVDLETGLDHDLLLAIPFRGDFPLPEHGFFAPGFTHASSPHLLGISGLSVERNLLRIGMSRDEKRSGDAALEFEIGKLRTPGIGAGK